MINTFLPNLVSATVLFYGGHLVLSKMVGVGCRVWAVGCGYKSLHLSYIFCYFTFMKILETGPLPGHRGQPEASLPSTLHSKVRTLDSPCTCNTVWGARGS